MLSPLPRLKVVVLSSIWPAAVDRLRTRHDVQVAVDVPPDRLPIVLEQAEVVVVRSDVRLDRGAVQSAPKLRLIVRAGMGLDGIDCEFARQRQIRVMSAPLSAESVAEHTLGLMLAIGHQIVRHDRALRYGRWEKHGNYGCDLFGRHLGVLGFGLIGQRTAELSNAFGMRVSACDRSPEKPAKQQAAKQLGVRFVSIDELFSSVHFLAIQAPLNEATRGLVDARLLSTMRCDAVLINVGRGGIVDERALYEALHEGRLFAAALDVFEREPAEKSPLFTLPNFIGTPHVAAQTVDAQMRVGESVIDIIDCFADGARESAQGVVVV
jgi:phosphoglycerate dehydrogenase-like enzyme